MFATKESSDAAEALGFAETSGFAGLSEGVLQPASAIPTTARAKIFFIPKFPFLDLKNERLGAS
jgi:hypothetical protein